MKENYFVEGQTQKWEVNVEEEIKTTLDQIDIFQKKKDAIIKEFHEGHMTLEKIATYHSELDEIESHLYLLNEKIKKYS